MQVSNMETLLFPFERRKGVSQRIKLKRYLGREEKEFLTQNKGAKYG